MPAGLRGDACGECRDLEASLAGLGTEFWFETVQHKFHACCHGTHATLEALNALRHSPDFSLASVKSVALRVNPRWLRVCDIPAPRTALEAKFSYRLTSAMALAGWIPARSMSSRPRLAPAPICCRCATA